MSTLLGKIERFNARGQKMMLPRLAFRVNQHDFDYLGDEFSFVWLGHNDPTPEEWQRIARENVHPHLINAFGKDHADKLLLSLVHPLAEAVV